MSTERPQQEQDVPLDLRLQTDLRDKKEKSRDELFLAFNLLQKDLKNKEDKSWDVVSDLSLLQKDLFEKSWNFNLQIYDLNGCDFEFGFFTEFGFLKENSSAFYMARVLQKVLDYELFRKDQLEKIPEIRVYFRRLEEDPIPDPPNWIQQACGTTVNMDHFGTRGQDFVIWGEMMMGYEESGVYQVYIILASLRPAIQMEELHKKGFVVKIETYLRLWLRGYQKLAKKLYSTFVEELLDKLACPELPAAP